MEPRELLCIMVMVCAWAGTAVAQEGGASGSANPLLEEWRTPFGVPPFDQIKPEHFEPAFDLAIKQQQEEIQRIVESKEAATFQNTLEALDRSGALLDKVRPVFFGLMGANTTDELQAIAERVLPKLVALDDDILLNPVLFQRVATVYEARTTLGLTPEQVRLVEETYKGFVRGGAKLDQAGQARLRELNKELSLLGLAFGNNLLKETTNFQLIVASKEELAGVPEGLMNQAAEAARKAGHEGKWLFTLDAPVLWPFLQSAENRQLRQKMLQAYERRGNNNNEFDNKENVKRQIALRSEKARLLGYPTWAHFQLDDRMAKSPDAVFGLLEQVWKPALEKAHREIGEMQAVIDREGGTFKLEAWDWHYYAEKVRKEKYGLDDAELRPYFPLQGVLLGAFDVVNRLYGLTFHEVTGVALYHPEVRMFEVKDKDGSHLGVFLVDYHPRPSKRGGAWCGAYRGQYIRDGIDVRPIMVNVGNFTKPTDEVPALLSVDEAETLFHELGHALHGLMSRVHYPSIGGVPRDFVELPSQIMENWVLRPEVLALYAKDYRTGKAIPKELVEKIERSRQFNQGFATVEYVAASYLDLKWHLLTGEESLDVEKFERSTLEQLGLMGEILPRYRSTYFQHIFGSGGSYSAGYYSYMWSEVLDSDAFAAFEEKGLFDQETSTRFRVEVLEKGGTAEAGEMYRKFRGRDPVVGPLLRKRGLAK